jgi:hypothetical protein
MRAPEARGLPEGTKAAGPDTDGRASQFKGSLRRRDIVQSAATEFVFGFSICCDLNVVVAW